MGLLDPPARPIPGVGGSLLNFSNPTKFLKWRRAVSQLRFGAADAKILCIGDSTTAGIGGSTSGTVPQNRSWPTAFVTAMNAGYAPTARGLAIPRSKGSSQTADTRWSGGAGWALNSQISQQWVGFGGFGCFWGSATASTSLTYADGVLADTYDIYYVSLSSNATFEATATGGSSVTGTQPGGSANLRKITVSAGSASTSNTVTITHDATTKALFIVGIEPRLAATKQILVGNAGASGSSTAEWTGYPYGLTSNTYGPIDAIKTYAPHLSIIDLGINDAGAAMPASTFMANLVQIITAAQISGDVILKTMIPSDPTATPNRLPLEQEYVAVIKSLGLPVIDTFGRIGSYASYQAGGFMNDAVHAGSDGYADVGSSVAVAIRSIA